MTSDIEDDTDPRSNPSAEQRLWRALRGRRLRGWKFRRKAEIAGHVVTFVCMDATLVIEVDPFAGEAKSESSRKKTAALEKAGFKVIRFVEADVNANFELTMQAIFNAAEPRIYQKPLPDAVKKKKKAKDPK